MFICSPNVTSLEEDLMFLWAQKTSWVATKTRIFFQLCNDRRCNMVQSDRIWLFLGKLCNTNLMKKPTQFFLIFNALRLLIGFETS